MTDLVLLVLFLLSFLCMNNTHKNKIWQYLLSLIIILLFGLRHYTVGVDSANYAFRYETLTYLEPFEIGFVYFMKSLHYICSSYTFFFLITSMIIWGGLIRFYSRYTVSYWLALFLFCALGGINTIANNGLRQGISIVLFLIAISCAMQKKIAMYYILAIIAFCFHRSAVFILPIYFLIQQKFKLWKIFPFVIIFFIGTLYADSFTNYFFSDYERYLVEVEQVNKGKFIQLGLISMFAIIPLGYRYNNRENKHNFILNNMFLWLMPLYLIFAWGVYISRVGVALNRLAWYMFPIVFLNFSNYIDTKPSKTRVFIISLIIGLIFCYRLGVYYFSGSSEQADLIYYYKFFWQ